MSSPDPSYGVVYKPTKPAGDSAPSTAQIIQLCHAHGISFVRIQWCDLINTARYRILPTAYFFKLLGTARPGVGVAASVLGLVGCEMAPGFTATGEYLYAVDLSSFRVCTYAPGHASVMGWFQETSPAPGRTLEYEMCPRTLLKRIVDEAQENLGLSFLAGFESEFILLKSTDPLVTVNGADWSSSAKLPTGSVEAIVLEEMARCLIDGGVELQMYHAEAAPGQYEIVTGPLAPVEAADALVYTRETIYNIAAKHGLRATFAPRLHSDNCGNGAHMHFSIHSRTPPPSSPAKVGRSMNATERSFLAGLLARLPAVSLLALPTAASYARMLDGIWSGGTYSCWGTENKDVPLRLCGSVGHHHFELKTNDGTANPYLVLAGVLGAGIRGVREGAELTIDDCAKPVFQMTEGERKAVGLENPSRLPKSVDEARRLFEEDRAVKEIVGGNFVEKFLAVNKLLEKFLKKDTEDATVTKLVTFY